MAKRVRFEDEARQALWRGVDTLASAVRITLGPRGRSVVFDRLNGVPSITRDGIAVASEIELADPFENIGVRLLREAAFHTGELAGDGTSTATVLAHRLIGDGLAAVAAGHHPQTVRRGIERAASATLARLAGIARAVEAGRDLERIAIVAAGDRALGELVARALARVGRDAAVTIESGQGFDTTLDVVEGVRIDGGYLSPYFITHPADMEAALEHPLIALIDGTLDSPAAMAGILEQATRLGRPLLLLCERLASEALAVLVVNRLRGMASSVAVGLPHGPEARRELLADLALVTGGAVVADELGRAAERFETAWFGRARRVRVGADHTTLLQGGGRGEALAERRAALRAALAAAEDDAERRVLAARLARLAGVVATIRAGAPSEFEQHARRAQLEDALAASQAALEEGVVPGGGVALLRARDAAAALALAGGEAAGRDALLAALAEPLRQIGLNAGEDGGEVVARVAAGRGAFGYNARTRRYADLEADGVLDPVRVVRCALQNAVSVAGLVLTTDVLVIEDDAAPGGGEAAA